MALQLEPWTPQAVSSVLREDTILDQGPVALGLAHLAQQEHIVLVAVSQWQPHVLTVRRVHTTLKQESRLRLAQSAWLESIVQALDPDQTMSVAPALLESTLLEQGLHR